MQVLALIGILIFTAALVFAAAAALAAHALVCPPRLSDARAVWLLGRLSPGDLGLPFENVRFPIRDTATGDPLEVFGWWIRHPAAKGSVVLLHGYGDAKIGAMAWAPMLHELGWNILAMDLRAHGESGGRYCTGGIREAEDMLQVVHQLRLERPGDTQTLLLFGLGLGAAVACGVAAQPDLEIAGIIADSPFAKYEQAAHFHLRAVGAYGQLLQWAAMKWAGRLCGVNLASSRPVDMLPRVRSPILMILSGDDATLDAADAASLSDALIGRSHARDVLWRVPNAGHLLALVAEPEEYAREVKAFLTSAATKEPQAG